MFVLCVFDRPLLLKCLKNRPIHIFQNHTIQLFKEPQYKKERKLPLMNFASYVILAGAVNDAIDAMKPHDVWVAASGLEGLESSTASKY